MEMAAILVHSLNRFSLCTKMAAVAVLCCDIMQRGESVTRWEASSVVSFKPEMGLVLMIFMAKLNSFLPTYWILILAEDLKPTIGMARNIDQIETTPYGS